MSFQNPSPAGNSSGLPGNVDVRRSLANLKQQQVQLRYRIDPYIRDRDRKPLGDWACLTIHVQLRDMERAIEEMQRLLGIRPL
jgi:hypothetical protein